MNERCTSAEDARKALARNLDELPPIASEYALVPFDQVAGTWRSEWLWRGNYAGITSLIGANLHMIAQKAEFECFDVEIYDRGGKVIQVSALCDKYFVPVQTWRSSTDYFALGNSVLQNIFLDADEDEVIREVVTNELYDQARQQRLAAREAGLFG